MRGAFLGRDVPAEAYTVRLGELDASTLALSRVLEQDGGSCARARGVLALRASNAKIQWIGQMAAQGSCSPAALALESGFLYEAADDYHEGYWKIRTITSRGSTLCRSAR